MLKRFAKNRSDIIGGHNNQSHHRPEFGWMYNRGGRSKHLLAEQLHDFLTNLTKHPPSILAAGYIGSTLFGGVFILAGFDTLISKIMSFIIGFGLRAFHFVENNIIA